MVGAPHVATSDAPLAKQVTAKSKKRRPQTRAAEPVELVVRRGALRRFEQLKQKTEALPVKVLWDRRQSDRRVGSSAPNPDQRKSERRQAPPYTWDIADFVVVGRPRKARPKKAN
jgi:hypothetical protein